MSTLPSEGGLPGGHNYPPPGSPPAGSGMVSDMSSSRSASPTSPRKRNIDDSMWSSSQYRDYVGEEAYASVVAQMKQIMWIV